MDIYSKEKRSLIMGLVRANNTKPEMIVRKLLHGLGFRFSLRRKDLPGKPDIVLPKYNAAIFVHGCFWHHHEDCKKSALPKTNVNFWRNKIMANVKRDNRAVSELKDLGWKVMILWDCEIKSIDLKSRLINFLKG